MSEGLYGGKNDTRRNQRAKAMKSVFTLVEYTVLECSLGSSVVVLLHRCINIPRGIVWHTWENPVVAVYGVVPAATMVPVFSSIVHIPALYRATLLYPGRYPGTSSGIPGYIVISIPHETSP